MSVRDMELCKWKSCWRSGLLHAVLVYLSNVMSSFLELGQISPGSVSRRLMVESVISSFLEISCSVLEASAN